MEQSITLVLLYSLLPVFCMIIGGLVSTSRLPEQTLGNGIQHCAAGVVFAAVALELLPKVVSASAPWSMVIGFVMGLGLMFGIKAVIEYMQQPPKQQKKTKATKLHISRWLLGGMGIDVFVDGVLISVAFVAGAKGGILIALALAVEELFLGMTLRKKLKRMKYNMGLACLIILGVLVGFGVMQILPVAATTFILSLGMAALLYLVTEELLTEVHSKLETPWVTAMFFVGFLFILIIETTLW